MSVVVVYVCVLCGVSVVYLVFGVNALRVVLSSTRGPRAVVRKYLA